MTTVHLRSVKSPVSPAQPLASAAAANDDLARLHKNDNARITFYARLFWDVYKDSRYHLKGQIVK